MSAPELTATPAAPTVAPPPAAAPAPAAANAATVLLRVAGADDEVRYHQVTAPAAREQALEDAHAHGGSARVFAVAIGAGGLPISERHVFDVDLSGVAPITLTSGQDQRSVKELIDLLERASNTLADADFSDEQIATVRAHTAELRAARTNALAGAFADGKAPE